MDRVLKKYSPGFNNIFNFFLRAYRKDILTFCGSAVVIKGDSKASDARFSFREFDNGRYRIDQLVTRHPNILTAIITGKKAWGLWVKEWSDGIAKGLFTKAEIWDTFTAAGIGIPLETQDPYFRAIFVDAFTQFIPDALFNEFENAIEKARTTSGDSKAYTKFRMTTWESQFKTKSHA